MKQHFHSNNKGFTLIEVILSIAILSIVSVVVLRLFVTSHELNEQSRAIDLASNTASNVLESIKGYRDFDTFISEFDWLDGDTTHLNGTIVYDESFKQESGLSIYTLNCEMIASRDYTTLYDITITVLDHNHESLATYATSHYFVEGTVTK